MKAERVIQTARKYLGYVEKKSNSQLEDFTANAGSGNWTIFALRLYEAGYYNGNKNGYAWCDCFTDYVFYEAADLDAEEAQRVECQTGDLGAGCLYSAGYYKSAGRFDQTPRAGDQIFFYVNGTIGHTGIVEECDDWTVTTIEGNSNDRVQRRNYTRGNTTIAGYGHPLYEESDITTEIKEASQSATAEYTGLPTIRRGDSSEAVKAMQHALLYAGEKLPRWGADGECGDETVSAVKSFQKKMGLFQDGVCGAKTWRAIMEGKT